MNEFIKIINLHINLSIFNYMCLNIITIIFNYLYLRIKLTEFIYVEDQIY